MQYIHKASSINLEIFTYKISTESKTKQNKTNHIRNYPSPSSFIYSLNHFKIFSHSLTFKFKLLGIIFLCVRIQIVRPDNFVFGQFAAEQSDADNKVSYFKWFRWG
ncbi:hypothetical protein MKX01_027204 [Papaver californicum]|nr:hypothetical protein MKX01_027204 [Papaver californicum]